MKNNKDNEFRIYCDHKNKKVKIKGVGKKITSPKGGYINIQVLRCSEDCNLDCCYNYESKRIVAIVI
jgi:hypothetical protein